jgi:kynurenine 3-monooxygenase
MPRVIIIGAGLAGSLLAIYLAKRGIQVEVFEARVDMRKSAVDGGRSINLALSDRGIAALREVGMDEYMLAEAVPMYGRMIHSVSGEKKLLPYSGRKGEFINSVSRAGLNIALINEAEKYENVHFLFNQRCTQFRTDIGEAILQNGRTARGDTVIATDGAGSVVRDAMKGTVNNFQVSQVLLDHGYKELHIPEPSKLSVTVPQGEEFKFVVPFAMEPNALHIWPREKFMMIALPNYDGSFTCTLFLAHSSRNTSEPAFDQLSKPEYVVEFFKKEFPDAVPLMPTLADDFFRNPTGNLGTVKCWPWNAGGRSLLLGDSAHAMVPFFGQGMNCAFEDIRVLDQLIAKHGPQWESIYWKYGDLRKFNTDAISEMAEENFFEMRDKVADPVFQKKRELEMRLEHAYDEYFSKYSMVTFREDMPYTEAQEKGNAQDKLLMEIAAKTDDPSTIDLDDVMRQVKALHYQMQST